MAMSLVANPILVEDYVETSKQITKALKCVAFTNMQVGDMMLRKHERLEKRIFSISEEIELLQADVVENVVNQRERRQQLTDIEEDLERAEVLGNALMVEELLAELKVLQDEGKREEALFRSIKKALRSRRRVKKEFVAEKRVVEDEMRTFNRKQNLIQSLLTTFAKDSAVGGNSQSSSASQSDCGSNASDLDDSLLSLGPDDADAKSEPNFAHKRSSHTHGFKLAPALKTRPRRWSADGSYPLTSPPQQKQKTRARRSLSVTFSPTRPHSLGSVEEEEDDEELAEREPLKTEAEEDAVAAAAVAETLFKRVEADATAVSLLLEEIHDEQDNFYSHSSESSESSGDDGSGDSGSEVEDEDDVREIADVAYETMDVVKAEAKASPGVDSQTLVVDEEDTVVTTTATTSLMATADAVTRVSVVKSTTERHSSSVILTKTSSDQVEVALAHTRDVESVEQQVAPLAA